MVEAREIHGVNNLPKTIHYNLINSEVKDIIGYNGYESLGLSIVDLNDIGLSEEDFDFLITYFSEDFIGSSKNRILRTLTRNIDKIKCILDNKKLTLFIIDFFEIDYFYGTLKSLTSIIEEYSKFNNFEYICKKFYINSFSKMDKLFNCFPHKVNKEDLDFFIDELNLVSYNDLKNASNIIRYSFLKDYISEMKEIWDYMKKINDFSEIEVGILIDKKFGDSIFEIINKIGAEDIIDSGYYSGNPNYGDETSYIRSFGLSDAELNSIANHKGTPTTNSHIKLSHSIYSSIETVLLSSALKKLPNYKGKVYRGLRKFDIKIFKANIKDGIWLDNGGFTGTSKSKSVAEGFSREAFFEISSKSGKYIEKDENYMEEEILFDIGTKFKVISMEKDKSINKWFIKMEEI